MFEDVWYYGCVKEEVVTLCNNLLMVGIYLSAIFNY